MMKLKRFLPDFPVKIIQEDWSLEGVVVELIFPFFDSAIDVFAASMPALVSDISIDAAIAIIRIFQVERMVRYVLFNGLMVKALMLKV